MCLLIPLALPIVLLRHGYEWSATASQRFVPLVMTALVMITTSVVEAFLHTRATVPAGWGLRWGRRALYALAWGAFVLAALDRAFVPARARWNAALERRMFDLSDPHACRLVPSTSAYSRDANNVVHSVRINPQGFRGRDFTRARARPDDLRVALFGDSLIFGIGVDQGETLPEQLERALRAELPGRQVEVMNFGIPCTTLVTAATNALHVAMPYEPDALVFSMSTNIRPFDICARLRQLQRSRLLRFLITLPRGVELVNSLQLRVPEHDELSLAGPRSREALGRLVPMQRRAGFAVALFQFWNEFGLDETIQAVRPPGLEVFRVSDGTDFNTYTRRWAIPGDGHPTSAGHRHYAAVLARALAPRLRERRLPH